MIPLFLWLLATIDSAFIGYREAAGRNALIDKRAYYRRALIRGALVGQVAVLIVGAITAIMLVSSNDAAALFAKIESVGVRMLTVKLRVTNLPGAVSTLSHIRRRNSALIVVIVAVSVSPKVTVTL